MRTPQDGMRHLFKRGGAGHAPVGLSEGIGAPKSRLPRLLHL
jgi:hypothetical protein